MSRSNPHIKYTAADIRRYLDGKMSDEQMHLLEKAALADPFLADAIEGMREADYKYGAAAFDTAVSELRSKLKNSRKRHSIPVFWKVAAMLLVITTGIAITLYMQKDDNENAVTVSELKTTAPEAKVDTPQRAEVRVDSQKEAASASVPSAKIKREEGAENQRARAINPSVPENAIVTQDMEKEENKEITRQHDVAAEVEKIPDTPHVAGVEKVLQGKAAGISVQKAGQRRKADEPDTLQSELNEVVVMGYSKKRRSAPESMIYKASRFEPEIGWSAFEEYILNNRQLPDSVGSIHGMERISFVIGQDGKAQDFRILRSVSPAHDAETIRLLTDGPAWKVLKGRKNRFVLGIRF